MKTPCHCIGSLILMIFASISSGFILPTDSDFANDNNKMTWSEAENHCLTTYSSHLLSIHDSFSFSQIRAKIHKINQDSQNFWIGLVNTNPTGDKPTYEWSDNTPFNFGVDLSGTFPWFDERPETPHIFTRVRLWGGAAAFLWDDAAEDAKYFWICNDSPTTLSPTKRPTPSPTPTININNNAPNTNIQPVIQSTNNTKNIQQQQSATQKESVYVQPISTSETDLSVIWKVLIILVLIFSCCVILWLMHLYRMKILEMSIWKRKIFDTVMSQSTPNSRVSRKNTSDYEKQTDIDIDIDIDIDNVEDKPEEQVVGELTDAEEPMNDGPRSKSAGARSKSTASSVASTYTYTIHNKPPFSEPSPPTLLIPDVIQRAHLPKHLQRSPQHLNPPPHNTPISQRPIMKFSVVSNTVSMQPRAIYDDVEDQPSLGDRRYGYILGHHHQTKTTPISPGSNHHSDGPNPLYSPSTGAHRYDLSREVSYNYQDRDTMDLAKRLRTDTLIQQEVNPKSPSIKIDRVDDVGQLVIDEEHKYDIIEHEEENQRNYRVRKAHSVPKKETQRAGDRARRIKSNISMYTDVYATGREMAHRYIMEKLSEHAMSRAGSNDSTSSLQDDHELDMDNMDALEPQSIKNKAYDTLSVAAAYHITRTMKTEDIERAFNDGTGSFLEEEEEEEEEEDDVSGNDDDEKDLEDTYPHSTRYSGHFDEEYKRHPQRFTDLTVIEHEGSPFSSAETTDDETDETEVEETDVDNNDVGDGDGDGEDEGDEGDKERLEFEIADAQKLRPRHFKHDSGTFIMN